MREGRRGGWRMVYEGETQLEAMGHKEEVEQAKEEEQEGARKEKVKVRC